MGPGVLPYEAEIAYRRERIMADFASGRHHAQEAPKRSRGHRLRVLGRLAGVVGVH